MRKPANFAMQSIWVHNIWQCALRIKDAVTFGRILDFLGEIITIKEG